MLLLCLFTAVFSAPLLAAPEGDPAPVAAPAEDAPPPSSPEPEPETEPEPEAKPEPGAPPSPLSAEQMGGAEPVPLYLEDPGIEEAETLTAEELEFFRPERSRLPQTPYAWTPWSAYALEFGESRVGLTQLALGVAPRVQLGTSVPLNVLGVFNGQLKANLVRVGPVDLALVAAYYTLPRQDFSGEWLQAGGLVSVRVADPVTLHLGSRWGRIQASGLPDLGAAAGTLSGGNGDALDEWLVLAEELGVELALDSTAIQASAALDWRFNRRDSLVLQAQATPQARYDRSISAQEESLEADLVVTEAEKRINDLPPVLYLDQVLSSEGTLGERIASSAVVSLSYQASFKNMTLRLGGGWSAVRWAWVLPATELSFHFGGKTRAEERRMNKGYRNNQRALEGGADGE